MLCAHSSVYCSRAQSPSASTGVERCGCRRTMHRLLRDLATLYTPSTLTCRAWEFSVASVITAVSASLEREPIPSPSAEQRHNRSPTPHRSVPCSRVPWSSLSVCVFCPSRDFPPYAPRWRSADTWGDSRLRVSGRESDERVGENRRFVFL